MASQKWEVWMRGGLAAGLLSPGISGQVSGSPDWFGSRNFLTSMMSLIDNIIFRHKFQEVQNVT